MVLILTGPPGVGKTTVAGVLADRTERAVHLQADRFFEFVRTGYVEPWKPESHEQNATVMGIVANAAAGYASAGYFTIVEGILIPGWFLEPVRKALHEAGCPASIAILRAPLTLCLERAMGRDGAIGDRSVIEQIWRQFDDLGQLEPHAIDVEGRAPEDVADLVDAAIARAG